MQHPPTHHEKALPSGDHADAPFGSNEVRLSIREWLAAGAIVLAVLFAVPRAWSWIEPLGAGPDYRIPYPLGNDYWVYDRWCRTAADDENVLLIGDSVIWGHYVATDGTLSHHLNQRSPAAGFRNLGVDGIHPAAMAGLVEYYGGAISGKPVILHCNLLWMSSKRHDLQITKEFAFNHPALVPQFVPSIPCYREPLSDRIAIAIQRHLPFAAWARHVRLAYFNDTDLPRWTTEHPYESPAAAVTLELPSPDEPPSPPPVAVAWTDREIGEFNPPWVELDTSFQWRSFQETLETLLRRGNHVFVLVGPLNEHMLTERSRQVYLERKHNVQSWLEKHAIPHYVPPPLPSPTYADASHPLSEGYAMLADKLLRSESFARFLHARGETVRHLTTPNLPDKAG